MQRRRTKPVHYQLQYQEANPDLIRIETAEEPDLSYYYLTTDLGGVGACNCPKSLMRVYKVRSALVRQYVERFGLEETLRRADEIRQLSGTCPHEIMVFETEKLRERIEAKLTHRFGERPWKVTTTVAIGDALRVIHEKLRIQCSAANESLWVEYGIEAYLETLLATSPQQDGRPMNPPDWIWKNKTILLRNLHLTQARIEDKLTAAERTFHNAIQSLQQYLSQMHEAASISGHVTPPDKLVEGFCIEIQPWLSEAQKAALGFIALRQEAKPTTTLSFEDRETLCRFGGRGRIFVELFG